MEGLVWSKYLLVITLKCYSLSDSRSLYFLFKGLLSSFIYSSLHIRLFLDKSDFSPYFYETLEMIDYLELISVLVILHLCIKHPKICKPYVPRAGSPRYGLVPRAGSPCYILVPRAASPGYIFVHRAGSPRYSFVPRAVSPKIPSCT